MDPESAATLINHAIYKPGWVILAEDYSARYEGTIRVCITFPDVEAGIQSLIETLAEEWGTPDETDIERVRRIYDAGFINGVAYIMSQE